MWPWKLRLLCNLHQKRLLVTPRIILVNDYLQMLQTDDRYRLDSFLYRHVYTSAKGYHSLFWKSLIYSAAIHFFYNVLLFRFVCSLKYSVKVLSHCRNAAVAAIPVKTIEPLDSNNWFVTKICPSTCSFPCRWWWGCWNTRLDRDYPRWYWGDLVPKSSILN